MRSTFQLPALADSNSSVSVAWWRAVDTATIDSATVVAAIRAKIAYSLAAIESFGKFTSWPPGPCHIGPEAAIVRINC